MTLTTAGTARYEGLRSGIEAMLTVPEKFNFVTDTFERWSSDRLCMRWIDDSGGDRQISWKQMSDNANRVVHPSVAESAVVSSPDDIRGEIVKAFVVLKPGFTASDALVIELQDHCKKVTAPYKYPRKIDFVTALPKTVSGKIRRIELRNKEWGRPIPASNERE